MEENVGEDPEVMNGILDHAIRKFKHENLQTITMDKL